jgi:hypothetical protein
VCILLSGFYPAIVLSSFRSVSDPKWYKGGKKLFSIQSILSYNLKYMAQEIITLEDLQKFRLQLLGDPRRLLQQPNHSQKQWLKSSEVRCLASRWLSGLMAHYQTFVSKSNSLSKDRRINVLIILFRAVQSASLFTILTGIKVLDHLVQGQSNF